MAERRRRRKGRISGRWVATKGEKWIFVICVFLAISTSVVWLARSAYSDRSAAQLPDSGVPEDILVRVLESEGNGRVTTKPQSETEKAEDASQKARRDTARPSGARLP